MLKSLSVGNFKCFRNLSLPLSPLTLLTGINGGGKTSALQALLLLRQSARGGVLYDGRLALNGEYTRIGTGQDALFEHADAEIISLGFASAAGSFSWDFAYTRDASILEPVRHSINQNGVGLATEALIGENFRYLCAERVGPRTSSEISDSTVRDHHQLGFRGEFAAQYLSLFGTNKIELQSTLKAVSAQLLPQVEAWLSEITPGTRLKVTPHASLDLVQLQYEFTHGADVSDSYRPTNVGFGLTYTLPVLVSVLSARSGTLLILENPEAHLHPRGQAKMGELLARAASDGVQILVETHSDHVLNGIRLAVYEGLLKPADLSIHYFERAEAAAAGHRRQSPTIDENGRLSAWPPGFFDQWDLALSRLILPKS